MRQLRDELRRFVFEHARDSALPTVLVTHDEADAAAAGGALIRLGDDMNPALCIVMPVLDEAETLAARLRALQRFRQRGVRVVVVDGGSQDGTLAIARAHADLALLAPRGRAAQMNAGAAACPAEVLLFLHADTELPDHADALVRRATLGPQAWGRFDVRIDSPRWPLRLVAALMNHALALDRHCHRRPGAVRAPRACSSRSVAFPTCR